MSLPKNSYVIFGLLNFGEQSGYNLKQLTDNSVGHFFGSPVRSQIYSELRRLYSITDEGLSALRTWLSNTNTSNDVIKSHLLLKIFFGKHMDRDELIAEVEGYRSSRLRVHRTAPADPDEPRRRAGNALHLPNDRPRYLTCPCQYRVGRQSDRAAQERQFRLLMELY